jgi:hypothetical protein
MIDDYSGWFSGILIIIGANSISREDVGSVTQTQASGEEMAMEWGT